MRLVPLLPLLFALAVHATEFQVASGLKLSAGPSIAAGNDDLLVVWSDANGRVARRFTLDGFPLDRMPLRLTSDPLARVSLAFDGLQYLIAFAESDGAQARVTARFLSHDGQLSAPLVLLSGEREGTLLPRVAVAWNGIDFLVTWADSLRWNDAYVRAALISVDGRVLETATLAGPLQTVDGIDVASGSDRDLVVYAAQSSAGGQSYQALLESVVLDRALTAQSTSRIETLQGIYAGCSGITTLGIPDAVWNGHEWAVGWKHSSCRLGESIHAARLSANAAVLETRTITPARLATAKLEALTIRGEAVLLTQMFDVVSGVSAIDLVRLTGGAGSRRLLNPTGVFEAAATSDDRIAIASENSYLAGAEQGWSITVRLLNIDFTPVRRRAVR